MSKNGKTTSLVAAALLLSGLSLVGDATTDARAESAYPNVEALPPRRDKPAMTVDEQSKLKKELNDARDRQNSQVNAKEMARCDLNPKSLEEATTCADREELRSRAFYLQPAISIEPTAEAVTGSQLIRGNVGLRTENLTLVAPPT